MTEISSFIIAQSSRAKRGTSQNTQKGGVAQRTRRGFDLAFLRGSNFERDSCHRAGEVAEIIDMARGYGSGTRRDHAWCRQLHRVCRRANTASRIPQSTAPKGGSPSCRCRGRTFCSTRNECLDCGCKNKYRIIEVFFRYNSDRDGPNCRMGKPRFNSAHCYIK